MSRKLRDLGWLAALTLGLHLPFVTQPFHFDDTPYLDIARNVFRNPLFPLDMPYVVLGRHVMMWGHTHPPLISYLIAAIVFLQGGPPSEVVLHSVYLFFPLLATGSCYCLARRFAQFPFLATAIFACVPTSVVLAHTLQADLPLLAFWLCAVALFIHGNDRKDWRLEALAMLPLTSAVLTAYQGLALIPLLGFYAFQRGRLTKRTSLLLCLPFLILMGWQLLGYLHKGSSPASVLWGYVVTEKRVWLLSTKVRNAASTLGYLGGTFLFFPFLLIAFGRRWKGLSAVLGLATGIAGVAATYRLSAGYDWAQKAFFILCFAGGFVACQWALAHCLQRGLGKQRDSDTVFLSLWFLGVVFYCIVIFYYGSAHYLLPGVAPLILLLVRSNAAQLPGSGRWRAFYATLLPFQLVLALSLAHADYEVAETYRRAAFDFARQYLPAGNSFLFTAEWDLRYYLTALGGQIMADDTVAEPDELVVKSQNAASRIFDNQLDRSLEVVDRKTYRISSPLRLLDSRAKAGFWSDGWGVLPFWFSHQPLDEITVYRVGKRYKPPTVSRLGWKWSAPWLE